jgi:hypothetical protein
MKKVLLALLVSGVTLSPGLVVAAGEGSGSGGADSTKSTGSGTGGANSGGTTSGPGSPAQPAPNPSSPSASPSTDGSMSSHKTRLECLQAGGKWDVRAEKCGVKN